MLLWRCVRNARPWSEENLDRFGRPMSKFPNYCLASNGKSLDLAKVLLLTRILLSPIRVFLDDKAGLEREPDLFRNWREKRIQMKVTINLLANGGYEWFQIVQAYST